MNILQYNENPFTDDPSGEKLYDKIAVFFFHEISLYVLKLGTSFGNALRSLFIALCNALMKTASHQGYNISRHHCHNLVMTPCYHYLIGFYMTRLQVHDAYL